MPELVDFFVRHTDTTYVSHGEVLYGRAVGPHEWAADLRDVLEVGFSSCRFVSEPGTGDGTASPSPGAGTASPGSSDGTPSPGSFDGTDGTWIALAEREAELVGLAVVEYRQGYRPFGRLHDLVVHSAMRSAGVGRRLLDWVEAAVRLHGAHWLVLESGRSNHAAHAFFERAGYASTSVVMMKRLVPRDQR